MRKKRLSQSMNSKILVPLFFGILIPFLLMASGLIFFTYKQDIAGRREVNNKILEQLETSVLYNMEMTSRIAGTISSNGELVTFITKDYDSSTDFSYYVSSIRGIAVSAVSADYRSDIRIYSDNDTIPRGMGIFYHLSEIESNEAVRGFLDSGDMSRWVVGSDIPTDVYNPYMFSVNGCFVYLQKIHKVNGEFAGIIVFSIPEKYFFNSLQGSSENVLACKGMRVINMTEKNLSEAELQAVDAQPGRQFTASGKLCSLSTVSGFPVKIVVITSQGGSLFAIYAVVCAVVLVLIATTLLLVWYVKQTVRKMNLCIREMDCSVSNGFETRLDIPGEDELAGIAHNINHLLDNAQSLLRQTVQRETASKEAQLIALQHQINPHFIYNTMEVFSSKMELYGHYEESNAMAAFASIFRYNINTKEEFVPVREEIRQAANYLSIQMLRYPQLSMKTEISEDILRQKMPRFILQPLIENCIRHGEPGRGESLRILLTAEYISQSGKIIFSVGDNGKGISAGKLDELNSSFVRPLDNASLSSGEGSIGLNNINRRLRLYYGDDCHLEAFSRENEWTLISFSIPYVERIESDG